MHSITWFWLARDGILSESFIREFQNRLYWPFICQYQRLSEAFIREFQYHVEWWLISQYQILSESFICEFAYRVDWWRISRYQQLSIEFIRAHKDKIYVTENVDLIVKSAHTKQILMLTTLPESVIKLITEYLHSN